MPLLRSCWKLNVCHKNTEPGQSSGNLHYSHRPDLSWKRWTKMTVSLHNQSMCKQLSLLGTILFFSLNGCGGRITQEQSQAILHTLILSPTQNRFLIFNTLDHRVEASVETGQVPRDLVLGPDGLFFIANQMENSISIFQRNDRQTFFRIGKIGTVAQPHRLAYDRINRELWVASETTPQLAVYRVAGLRQPLLKQFVVLPQGSSISALFADSQGQKVWVADQVNSRLLELVRENDSFRVSEALKLPESSRISDIRQTGQDLFLLDEFRDQLYVVSTANAQLSATITLNPDRKENRPLLAERLEPNHAGTKLYLSASGISAVIVVDIKARQRLQTVALDSGTRFPAYVPLGLALSRDDRWLYVTGQQGRNLALLKTSPDPQVSDQLLQTMGTASSEALLPPLGVIRMVESLP